VSSTTWPSWRSPLLVNERIRSSSSMTNSRMVHSTMIEWLAHFRSHRCETK
jgi:hypothetical protein